MAFSDCGDSRAKIFVIQGAVIVTLVIGFRFYWPRLERAQAAREAAEREGKIEAAFRSLVEESAAPANAPAHSERLRRAASVEELEQALGAPESTMTDYAGGQHLTWTGTDHRLEAAFNKGELYALTLTDRRTGRGEIVFSLAAESHSF